MYMAIVYTSTMVEVLAPIFRLSYGGTCQGDLRFRKVMAKHRDGLVSSEME